MDKRTQLAVAEYVKECEATINLLSEMVPLKDFGTNFMDRLSVQEAKREAAKVAVGDGLDIRP